MKAKSKVTSKEIEMNHMENGSDEGRLIVSFIMHLLYSGILVNTLE
jgi:hypothetical protein